MSAVALLLGVAIATPTSAGPYPRPGQPGYSVAKAFTAIVRRDAEVNIQDLSYAFALPELLNQAFTWQGPFGGYEAPNFSAYYDPPDSTVGIMKIVINWNLEPSIQIDGRQAFSLGLKIFLKPSACPTSAEMEAATGVHDSAYHGLQPGIDGGPPWRSDAQSFAMPNGTGGTKKIIFSPGQCSLSASYIRES